MSNCSTVSWFRWPAGWDTGMWTPYIPHVASSMGLSRLNVGIPWWLSLWYHWGQFPMTLKVQLMQCFSQQLETQADLSTCAGLSSLVAKTVSWLKYETDPRVRTARPQKLRNTVLKSPASCYLRYHIQQSPTNFRNELLSVPSPSVSLECGREIH